MRTDRVTGALERALRALLGYVVSGPLDYHARYPGKVVAQSSDGGTVDILLDVDVDGGARRMPSPSTIPLRLGMPGLVAKVPQGERVLVGWDQGDPDKPFAELFASGSSASLLNITADGVSINTTSAALNAARKGDQITATSAMLAWAAIVETFINGVTPGTFTPTNQFAGANPTNPGGTGKLGAIAVGSSTVHIG